MFARETAGADWLGTTLVPPGPGDRRRGGPNVAAVADLAKAHPQRRILAEGRYATSEDVHAGFAAGATNVVVGRAITDVAALTTDLAAAAESALGRPRPPAAAPRA
ncbi:hypothetical protein [Jiangella sp. DSM 45060]|uniref:hypothetical protein n=1 Tax=Jiangella sp. DSM 45060 TaxID=1798224 RepID=UPI00087B9127|nr:hypothetical protein [Jiangella sp. DSM 45060]SDS47795.1 Putative N-acetylmannosamine-6-phosphate epimerase [Jiangella sp. DSM 45060]